MVRGCALRTAVVLAMVAAPAVGVPAAAAAVSAAELDASASATAGSSLRVVGRGFVLPAVTECEATWDGPRSTELMCVVKGRVQSRISLAEDHPSGTYTLTLCSPSCAHPWAGRTALSVEVAVPVTPSTTAAPPRIERSGVGEAGSTTASAIVTTAYDVGAHPRIRAAGARGHLGRPGADTSTRRQRPRLRQVAPGTSFTVSEPALPTPADELTACELRWDGASTKGDCRADRDGGLVGQVRVPRGTRAGDHEVTACRPSCADAAGGLARRVVRVAVPPTGPTTRPAPTPPTSTPNPALVTVPDLRGADLPAVRDLLAEAALRLDAVSGSGRVMDQRPAAGQEVVVGSPVDVRLAEGPVMVAVPDLRGRTVDQARAVLTSLGLVLADDHDASTTIAGQDPPPGTVVPSGSLLRVSVEASSDKALLVALVLAVALLLATAAAALRSRGARVRGPGAPTVLPHPDPVPEVSVHRSSAGLAPRLHLLSTPDTAPTTSLELSRDHAL